MEWLEAMKESIEYMEEHLLDDITAEDIARHVNISSFYFQKGFKIITGMTIGTYLRNRRLYLAALDIVAGNDKLIDLAYKYQYETPESFSKAFSRFHGISPMQIRKKRHGIKTFQPLIIKISVEGGNKMNYTIEKMDTFKVIGMTRNFSFDSSYEKIPQFWDEFCKNHMEKYCQQLGGCNIGKYGICLEGESQTKEFEYLIAGDYRNERVPEELKVVEIPAMTWARFQCVGPMPGALQSVNTRIFEEWIPGNSKYEIAAGLDIELYTEGDMSSPEYLSEIWIPIKEK